MTTHVEQMTASESLTANTGTELKLLALTSQSDADRVSADEERQRLTSTTESVDDELSQWGGGLIIVGIAHFFFSGFLSPDWGVTLIVVGLLNLVIHTRWMFIVNGLILFAAGGMNILGGGDWSFFGFLQLWWGIQEMTKFQRKA